MRPLKNCFSVIARHYGHRAVAICCAINEIASPSTSFDKAQDGLLGIAMTL